MCEAPGPIIEYILYLRVDLGQPKGEALLAPQDRVSGEAVGGREPLRTIGPRAAESARCRRGGLEKRRRALLKDAVRSPRRRLSLPRVALR